jgi:hypothetical protein
MSPAALVAVDAARIKLLATFEARGFGGRDRPNRMGGGGAVSMTSRVFNFVNNKFADFVCKMTSLSPRMPNIASYHRLDMREIRVLLYNPRYERNNKITSTTRSGEERSVAVIRWGIS